MASSTASDITTLVGTSGRQPSLKGGYAHQRPVHDGHAVQRPVDGVLGNKVVDAGLVLLDPPGQGGGVGLGRHRQFGQEVADSQLLYLRLVEKLQRTLPSTSPAPRPEQG